MRLNFWIYFENKKDRLLLSKTAWDEKIANGSKQNGIFSCLLLNSKQPLMH